jgi:hypothetical protein
MYPRKRNLCVFFVIFGIIIKQCPEAIHNSPIYEVPPLFLKIVCSYVLLVIAFFLFWDACFILRASFTEIVYVLVN